MQGLELDWTKSHVGRRPPLAWERLELSQFSRGPKDEVSRTDVKKPERRQYLKNAYRVLLTRARQGMVNALSCDLHDQSSARRNSNTVTSILGVILATTHRPCDFQALTPSFSKT